MALEMEMRDLGKERVQQRIAKAREKKNMGGLRPHRSLMAEWVMPVSKALQQWIEDSTKPRRGNPGMVSIALPCLQQLHPDTAAMVALKAVLRMLGVEHRGILAIAREIGTDCEHEARTKHWEETDGKDWRLAQATFKQQGSTSVHQRRSTIALFNKFKHEQLGWMDWTDQERIRVGLEMVNLVVTATQRFYIDGDPDWEPVRLPGGAWAQRPKVLMADAELTQWLDGKLEDELFHAPAFMPTLIPPLNWEGPRGGGYFTPYVKTPTLVRFKASNEEQRQVALNDFESYDMPNVYQSVNYVQGRAWKINTRVLAVADTIWDLDLAFAGMVRQEEETIPARPDVPKESTEYKNWARAAGEVHSRNAKRISHFIAQRRTILLARRMRDEPEFFFPHMLDFRGRMYPIVNDLSPQGRDLERGLLTAARGKPVDEDDAQWLAIHLANTYGVDKCGYGKRIAWVNAREGRWRQIAADPLGDRSWADEDDGDHWQRLAAIFEWVRWLDEGPGMISSLPLRVDGTCNGIQHLSAMVRDSDGGRFVNLVPSDRPQDIYREVATIVSRELQAKHKDPIPAMWLRLFGGEVPRAVTKKPVMILPYGGTKSAYFKYTMAWLKKADPFGEIIQTSMRAKAVSYLVPVLWECVNEIVIKALEVMEWIQNCCFVTSRNSAPLLWTTPAGFHVRHFYGKMESYRIKTRIDGQRLDLRGERLTKELDPAGQNRGVAPNFVHSMDASALMTCALKLEERGVEFFTAIHDAYGTVAGDMWTMTECLREAFIETYQTPVLENFLRDCKYAAGPEGDWPEMMPMGTLDINEIRHSDYFFA
ncbi:DNA-directed RNA polymerase [Mesorhizobium sp. M0767]|uniref:DNA-directed RNA polymerase n=1 Tax=Mesorhizobium sp. M0767 TaxID=2956995 RepID=UPI003336361B